MGFAVYHMEKGNGGAGGIGRHIDRIESKYGYTSFQHSDESKRPLNQNYILNDHCNKPLSKAIEDRIKEGYTQTRLIRKDAVKFQTHVLTGSHEEMKKIFEDKATSDKWVQENINWMCKKYGKENIVRFTLHMDERTPHIHAITVPITKDGGLSAKSYANGKKELRMLQTDYAKSMECFGLERGLERVGIRHESAQEYYARNKRLDELMNNPQIKVIEPKKGLFKTNIDELYKQNQYFSKLIVSNSLLLNEQKSKIAELSNTSIRAIHISRELATNKDYIIEKEVNERTSIYQRELDKAEKKLLVQEQILNSPEQLLERIKEIEELEKQKEAVKHKELLERFEKQIWSKLNLKIALGEKISITDIDALIREYAPKQELKVDNPWTALDIITDGERMNFENQLHKKLDSLQKEKEIELRLGRNIQKDIDVPERKRGRGRGI